MVSKRTAGRLAWALAFAIAVSVGPPAWGAAARQEGGSSSAAAADASRSQTIALGYLHTLFNAQREYKKKNSQYATSLRALVGKGSFTRRMAQTDRGDYQVRFHSNGKEYSVELVPKQFDPEHPSFYMDETGVVRSDPNSVATASSPKVLEKQ